MAQFINGDAIILSIWDDTSAYLPIACLTSNELSPTVNVIESQTKCDPGQIVRDYGSASYELSFEGRYIDTTSATGDNTKASHDFLFALQQAKKKVTWRMDTGLADIPYYYGTALITDLPMTAPAGDELVDFSGTFLGSGAIVETDPNV